MDWVHFTHYQQIDMANTGRDWMRVLPVFKRCEADRPKTIAPRGDVVKYRIEESIIMMKGQGTWEKALYYADGQWNWLALVGIVYHADTTRFVIPDKERWLFNWVYQKDALSLDIPNLELVGITTSKEETHRHLVTWNTFSAKFPFAL